MKMVSQKFKSPILASPKQKGNRLSKSYIDLCAELQELDPSMVFMVAMAMVIWPHKKYYPPLPAKFESVIYLRIFREQKE